LHNLILLTAPRQETALRQKRKERDAILKNQALSASKKRKRQDATDEPIVATTKLNPNDPLPSLLPDEYLQDEPTPSDISQSDSELPLKKAKKTKFTDLVEQEAERSEEGVDYISCG